MKAILLFLELKYTLERCQDDLAKLAAKLPPGSQRVLHADKTIGILIPPYDTLEAIRVRLYSALLPFRNIRMFGLSGETLCLNGSMDPIEGWMNNYRVAPIRKRPQAQHVPLTERRKPWRERPV